MQNHPVVLDQTVLCPQSIRKATFVFARGWLKNPLQMLHQGIACLC